MAKFKIPKKIGEIVDLKYQLRAKRHALQNQIKEISAHETALEQHLFKAFDNADIEGARGKLASASLSPRDVPVFDQNDPKADEKFFKYLQKTGEFDLLQRRLSSTAFEERWARGVKIPGIKKFQLVKLSVTKAGRSKKR